MELLVADVVAAQAKLQGLPRGLLADIINPP